MRQRLTVFPGASWVELRIKCTMQVCTTVSGNTIVSASSDSAVKLWDAATGRGIKTLQHLRQGFIAYSGDVQAPTLLHASGDAWRYLQALTDQGEVMPISRHSDWGTVYTPSWAGVR